MKKAVRPSRNAHFLGTKIRNLRKNNNLTMEDLSARCVKVDAEHAPSVSYLSMIERGKRVPSDPMLRVIAQVFQKDVGWFLDDTPNLEAIVPNRGSRGGIEGMALEPGFLFSPEILQIAIPEMLSQTGVSGRQFAHLLIRAHQESQLNHFPDLERAAEAVGGKQMPLSTDQLLDIAKELGLKIQWFNRVPKAFQEHLAAGRDIQIRSFFDAPDTIHINELLKQQPRRLKYDLAVYIGHKVLHNGDGNKSAMMAGHRDNLNSRDGNLDLSTSSAIDARDILHAWRDFESSFFAGALLLPRVPFRRLLESQAYEIGVNEMLDLTPSVVMRRMTAVSTYPHWHYFDAYPPGRLQAVYRGNGIPLPWGNMRMVQDPCQHWSVFRMIHSTETESAAQISVLEVNGSPRIYCCESQRVEDMIGNRHVLCAGIDINPAIEAQGEDALELADALREICNSNGGVAPIPGSISQSLQRAARILNIAWLERGLTRKARLICPRSGACPRSPKCQGSMTMGIN